MDNILGLCIILTTLTACQALQCFDCSYFKASSDSSVADTILKAINSVSNEACKLEKDGDDTSVAIKNCPAPGVGKVAKCAEFKGNIDTTVTLIALTISVNIETVSRNCIEVDADDQEYSDGCHNDLPSTAQNLFKNILSSVNLGELHFTGKACYSTSDLSTGSHSPAVSYLVLVLVVFLAYTRFGLV